MGTLVNAFIGVAMVVLAVSAVRVSAQAHHVVGGDNGWAAGFDVDSWLSGRVFTVGDKISFKCSGNEDKIVELPGLEELVSCNLTNPIKMYTDPTTHVVLEKEGPRYFASGDPERCKNGLKLPINVRPTYPPFPDEPTEFDPPFPDEPPSPHGPFPPVKPTPPYDPPVKPTPPYDPPGPVRPPPTPPTPSAASHLGVVSFVLAGGLIMWCLGI